MAQRFYVCRAYLKWKGKMYHKGDLLPENFTHHDKARSIYNSRIGVCEVPDTPLTGEESSAETLVNGSPESASSVESSEKGTQSADNKSKFNFSKPLTGTPNK